MPQRPMEEPLASRRRLRLLIVEDTPADAELMEAALRREPYALEIALVSSPEALRERLSQEDYDVVLCDHNLRTWTARDALDILKHSGKSIPFVVVTASLGEEAAVEYLKHGAADYVLKDRLARLPIAVSRALEEKHLREERERAEESLRETIETLQSLVQACPLPIVALDREEKVSLWNRAAIEVFGWSEQEVFGKPYPLVPEEGRAKHRANLDRILRGEQFTNLETFRQKKDGTRLRVNLSAAPIRDARGEIRGVMAVLEDVTERRRLEEQLRQATKMEAIGRLAGGISHDFNNLLSVILGYSDLVIEQLEPSHPHFKKMEEIKKAAERAIALTRQLLAFSRKQVLEQRVLDLNAVVQDMDKLLRRLIREDIELITVLNPSLGLLKADPGQIEQVIMNLAVNARDAMPQGGKLTIETANVELDETYSRKHAVVPPGPYVMLAVSDTGVGMDSETQAHIFEPFFTTKELGKGTGLGLATVYGIVKQSGGFIWVYSEPGQGATFKVYLPRTEEPVRVEEHSKARLESSQGWETILLVEDEEALRKLAREYLESHGYQVLEARNGAAALALAEQHQGPIHLTMTDVVMPGMSGRELAQQLNQLQPQMKVLYVSGYTDNAVVHQGLLEPGKAFLQKPYPMNALVKKIREVLSQRGEQAHA